MGDTVFELCKRLQKIADLVKGETVAEIGCDHAYLSIYLAVTRNISVYACDVREKPLEKAIENASRYCTKDNIKFLLSDGLKKVPYFIDSIVIAGLGGKTIEKMVFGSEIAKRENVQLVLGPQSFIYELRENLYLNGFYVEEEVLVFEKGKYYIIFSVKYNGISRKISLKEAVLGKLLKFKNNVTRQYILSLLKKEEVILKGLMKCKNRSNNKIARQREIFNILVDSLKEY